MILAIILLFVLCWGPLLIDNVLTSFRVLPELHYGSLKPIRQTFAIMAYSNSCFNPIVYAFMSKNFRSSFLSTIRSITHNSRCMRRPERRDGRLRCGGRQSSWRQDSLKSRRTTSFPLPSRDSSNSITVVPSPALSHSAFPHKGGREDAVVNKVQCKAEVLARANGSTCSILEHDDTPSDSEAGTRLVAIHNRQVAEELE